MPFLIDRPWKSVLSKGMFAFALAVAALGLGSSRAADTQAILLPEVQKRLGQPLDSATLRQIALWGIRGLTGSEVGLLPEGTLTGEEAFLEEVLESDRVTEGMVDRLVGPEDSMVRLTIKGSSLQKMAGQLGPGDAIRGLRAGQGPLKVNGRALDRGRHYVVSLPRGGLSTQPGEVLLGAVIRKEASFVRGRRGFLPFTRKRTVRLRGLLKEAFRRIARTPASTRPWVLNPYPREREVRFDHVTLGVEQFRVNNKPQFASVRDPRTKTKDSTLVKGRGTVSLVQDDASSTETLGVRFRYEQLRLPAGEVSEPGDDLVIFAERKWKRGLADPGLTGALIPFAELSYDTEFTATEGNPKDKLVRLFSGVASGGRGRLKELRFGAMLELDASLEARSTEKGLGLTAKWQSPFFFGLAATSKLDARFFFPSGSDTADDLKLWAMLENSLSMPLGRDISLALRADLFAYQGKVVDGTGSSLFLGLGLSYDRLWKLTYELF